MHAKTHLAFNATLYKKLAMLLCIAIICELFPLVTS